MIPTFPTFAPIGPAVRRAIADFAARFESCSEYNATNMWCWHGKYREVSALNHNLVLEFRDPETAALHLPFIGTNAVSETSATLLAAAGEQGLQPRLRLVPEVVVASDPGLGLSFAGPEERDADYLLSIAEWTSLEGSARAGARARTASCLQGFELFGDDALLAFLVCELVGRGCVRLHFRKADRAYTGVYMTSLLRCCQLLAADGHRTLHIGQDLGDAGMAAAKHSFRPYALLRKYTLAPLAA